MTRFDFFQIRGSVRYAAVLIGLPGVNVLTNWGLAVQSYSSTFTTGKVPFFLLVRMKAAAHREIILGSNVQLAPQETGSSNGVAAMVLSKQRCAGR